MAVLKAIALVSLYSDEEEKPLERSKKRVKVAEENKLFSSFTTTTATRTSPNKRFNEQKNSCALAL